MHGKEASETAGPVRVGIRADSHGVSWRVLLVVLISAGLVAATWLLLPERWCVLATLVIATVASVVMIALRRCANAMLVAATILVCLIVAEGYANLTTPTEIRAGGFAMDPALGRMPGATGQLRHARIRPLGGTTIFDVTYTINERHQRHVISATQGPTVAFFGDSFTFGAGLSDSDTLPQIFADMISRQMRVLNLAFSGYGTAQFLRAMETGRDDDQMASLRAVVMQTALWHAERTGCRRSFVVDAPRYELVDGKAVWQGACGDITWFRINRALARSAFYREYIEPVIARVSRRDIDLYVATLIQAGRIVREKFGVPTVVMYLPWPDYARHAGVTDAEIMRRLTDGGLLVVSGQLDRRDFPDQALTIPGDGHPTGVANRARASILMGTITPLLPAAHAN